MDTTTNYKLKKPVGAEFFNVEHSDYNADLIDSALKKIEDKADKNTASLTEKVNKSQIVNNALTTEEGYVADARQIKTLYDTMYKGNTYVGDGNTANLNDYTKMGFYYFSAETSPINAPGGIKYFFLDVKTAGGKIIQIVTNVIGGNMKQFVRIYNGGWLPWYIYTMTQI